MSSAHAVPGPAILDPGDYLLELAFARPPASREALVGGLAGAGLLRAVVDETAENEADEWSRDRGDPSRLFASGPPHLRRVVASVTSPLVPIDGPELAWLYARRAQIDVYGDILGDERLEPHELRQGRLYEVRFVSRMRSERGGSRAAIVDTLEKAMRFRVDKLACLKRDMRLPGRPNASDALWYGLLEWTGPDAPLTIEDPFFFQDVKEATP